MIKLKKAFNILDVFRLMRKGVSLRIVPNGWVEVKTGSATVAQTPMYINVASGATPSSISLAHAPTLGLGGNAGNALRINFAKKLVARFVFYINAGDENFVRYIQLKAETEHGNLATVGIGLKISNLTLYGESFGTERGEIELMSLIAAREYQITIEHDPVNGKINWYVGGVLKGTQSTSAKIPITASLAGRFLISTTNGATASASQIYCSSVDILQEA